MSLNNVDLTLPDDFDNLVKLFPLPNLVLFPGVIQALHIFEARYREMMADALASDELIAMALVEPGIESQFSDEPSLFRTVCIGKIVTHARLDDGRYNLLLMGAKRARILREVDCQAAYRMAEIEVCDDYLACNQERAAKLNQEIIRQFRALAAKRPQIDEESLEQLLREDLPLGQLVDLISYSSGMQPTDQQKVLDATDVCQRAEIMLSILQKQAERTHHEFEQVQLDFPPDFSLN